MDFSWRGYNNAIRIKEIKEYNYIFRSLIFIKS